MSRNMRLGLLALVVVIAVAAFVIAKPGSNDSASSSSPKGGTAVQRLAIKNYKPVGGVRSLKFKQGDQVRLEVTVDSPNTLHLHGYDIEINAKPGKPAVFKFKAKNQGLFELESHTAEHKGLPAQMARVEIEPS
jgi:FtsP/CotA-like multicopper oxidase with cupredoxin domain